MASGPFFPLPDAVLGLTPTNFDFTQFTQQNLDDGTATLAEVDNLVQQVLGDFNDLSDPVPEFDYFGLVDSLAATDFADETANNNTIIDSAPHFQPLLTDSINTAPDVSFLPQPPPFNPGADPTVNLNFPTGAQPPPLIPPPTNVGPVPIAPGVPIFAAPPEAPTAPTFTGGFNTLITALGYTVNLVDHTSFSQNSLVVGDQWTLTITGPPFKQITVDTWHDGVHIPLGPFGQLDGNGVLTVSGAMTPDQVGAWSQAFYDGDILIQMVAYFVVQTL